LAWDWFTRLRGYLRVTEEEYRRIEKQLTHVFREPASPPDVIMSMFDELALRETIRLPQVLAGQALFVAQRGGDPRPWLHQSKRLQLEIEFRRSPVIAGVKVSASYACCEECKAQNGDEYTIDEALNAMPLPFAGCTRHAYGPYPYCICTYTGVLKPPIEWWASELEVGVETVHHRSSDTTTSAPTVALNAADDLRAKERKWAIRVLWAGTAVIIAAMITHAIRG
jgi:hypothetical protein